jgi:hypothetical protein
VNKFSQVMVSAMVLGLITGSQAKAAEGDANAGADTTKAEKMSCKGKNGLSEKNKCKSGLKAHHKAAEAAAASDESAAPAAQDAKKDKNDCGGKNGCGGDSK